MTIGKKLPLLTRFSSFGSTKLTIRKRWVRTDTLSLLLSKAHELLSLHRNKQQKADEKIRFESCLMGFVHGTKLFLLLLVICYLPLFKYAWCVKFPLLCLHVMMSSVLPFFKSKKRIFQIKLLKMSSKRNFSRVSSCIKFPMNAFLSRSRDSILMFYLHDKSKHVYEFKWCTNLPAYKAWHCA